MDSLSFTGQYSRVVKLTASFADGYTGDVTAYADWSSSDAAIAEAAAGVVSAKSNGSATITATHGGKSVTIGVTVQIVPYDQGVSFLQLSATSLKFLDYSSAKQLEIRAYMFDGSWASVTADAKTQWTSSDSSVVTVDMGQVIPVGAGTAYVSASYMEKTAVAKVMVTNEPGSISAPMLVELTALPGQLSFTDPNPQAVKVIARYSDNTVTDVTYQAQWTSDDTNAVYYSSAEGAAVPADNSAGTVLKAVYNGLAAYVPVTVDLSQTPDTLDHLEVAYTSKLDVNADGSITVISSGGSAREHEVMLYAVYANGTRRNITQDAVWNTGNNAVVSLIDHSQRNTKGLFMNDDGDTDVTASYGGQQLVITVHSRFVTELSIQEAVSNKLYLDTPGAHPIHLIATFKNGATVDATTYAQYSTPLSSNVISIDGTGTIYAHSPGWGYFGATYAGFNASAEVFVRTPGLWLEGKGIYVRADQTVSQIELFNSQQAFTLYLNDWSDPQNPDVKKIDTAQATITWASGGDAVALINTTGGKLNLLPQNITGKGTLIVEYQGYRLEIPVVSHVVEDLNILDAVKDQGVAVSRYHDLGDHYFTVLATMSDGSVKDVTGLSIYYDDNDIAYVSSEYDLNFFSFGEATIKVEFGGRELEWKVIATDGSQGNGNYPVELYASSTGDINAAVSKQDYSQHGLEKPMMVADHLIVKFSENLATSQGYSVYLDGQVSNNWTDGASFNGNIMDLKLKAGAIPQGLHTLVIDGLEDANGNKMDPVVIYLYKQ
ncbi:Bacterial Ig-like domain (group 2) [compost metagenome]